MTTAASTLLTLEDAAERVHVSVKTMRRYIASGKLTGYRIGPTLIRLDATEVDALLRPIPSARSCASAARTRATTLPLAPPDEPFAARIVDGRMCHLKPGQLRWQADWLEALPPA